MPTRSDTKPVDAKFVRRDVKNSNMRGKALLKKKKSKVSINDEITKLRSRLNRMLQQKRDIKYVNLLIEKRTLCRKNNDIVLYNAPFGLHKAAPCGVLSVCRAISNSPFVQ